MKTLDVNELDRVFYDDNGLIHRWELYSEHVMSYVPCDVWFIKKNYWSKYEAATKLVQIELEKLNYPTDIYNPYERWIKATYDLRKKE